MVYRTRVVLIVLVLALGAPGCRKASPWGETLVRLRVGDHPHSALSPMYVSLDEGFFADENITLDLVRIETGSPASLAALVRGDLDVDSLGPKASFLNAISRGAKVRIVAGEGYVEPGPCIQFAWVARSDWFDAAGKLDTKKLKGARARYEPISHATFETDRALGTVGLSIEDLRKAPVPASLVVQALEHRDVDFAYLAAIPLVRAIAGHRVLIWKTLADVVPHPQIDTLVFAPHLLGKDRELGVRFLTAYLRGVGEMNRGVTPRIVEILSKRLSMTADEVRACCLPSFRPDGRVEEASWIEFQQWAAERGALYRTLSLREFANLSLLAEANRRLADRAR